MVRSNRRAPISRWLRWRAAMDALLALLAVPGVLLLSSDPHMQLRLAIVAGAFALMAFMIRRSQDFAAVRADLRARDAVLQGKGISIGQWHDGHPLPPWRDRFPAPVTPVRREPA